MMNANKIKGLAMNIEGLQSAKICVISGLKIGLEFNCCSTKINNINFLEQDLNLAIKPIISEWIERFKTELKTEIKKGE